MAVRPFVRWPDKRLKTAAAEVETVSEDVLTTLDDMLDTMYAMTGGVGLAAPQIGVMLRLAVLDCSGERDSPRKLINPRLVSASDDMSSYEEASPNLPGVAATVKRPATVDVSFDTPEGAHVTETFDGLWATSVQHQLDHLDGMIFVDRLSPTKRRMVLDRARKLARREKG